MPTVADEVKTQFKLFFKLILFLFSLGISVGKGKFSDKGEA